MESDEQRFEIWLAGRIASKDEQAWRLFFGKYFDPVYEFVYYRSGRDHSEAEDIVQEVFLECLSSIGRFDRQKGSLYNWLTGIARHKLARSRRQQKSNPTSLSLDDPAILAALARMDDAPLPDDIFSRDEVSQALGEVMSSLPPRYSSVLKDKYLRGKSINEIASDNGETPKAVESLLSRARDAFREKFLRLVKRMGKNDSRQFL